jgi:hypothetical protein
MVVRTIRPKVVLAVSGRRYKLSLGVSNPSLAIDNRYVNADSVENVDQNGIGRARPLPCIRLRSHVTGT